jgi:hypothetical protein
MSRPARAGPRAAGARASIIGQHFSLHAFRTHEGGRQDTADNVGCQAVSVWRGIIHHQEREHPMPLHCISDWNAPNSPNPPFSIVIEVHRMSEVALPPNRTVTVYRGLPRCLTSNLSTSSLSFSHSDCLIYYLRQLDTCYVPAHSAQLVYRNHVELSQLKTRRLSCQCC